MNREALLSREQNRSTHVCPDQHMPGFSVSTEALENQADKGLDWKGRRWFMARGERMRDLSLSRKH